MDEGSLWVSATLFVVVGLPVIVCVWLFTRDGAEPARQALGLFKINDFIVEKIRQAILSKCSAVKVGGLNRSKAQHLIGEVARHAIAETFAAVYPGRPFEVTRSWPQVSVIISGNIAVIDPWIGLDFSDDGEGIKPVNVEVDRAPALKLDTRKTIKSVFEQAHPLPSSRTDEPRKVATIAAPRGPTSPAPPTTPAPRPAPRKATLKR